MAVGMAALQQAPASIGARCCQRGAQAPFSIPGTCFLKAELSPTPSRWGGSERARLMARRGSGTAVNASYLLDLLISLFLQHCCSQDFSRRCCLFLALVVLSPVREAARAVAGGGTDASLCTAAIQRTGAAVNGKSRLIHEQE